MSTIRIKRIAILAPVAFIAAGCSTGAGFHEPQITTVNVTATTKLEFAVGTANIAQPGAPPVSGLNTVVSFRQATGGGTGLAGTLVNTPTITGPSGFVVPATSFAGIDGGTASITGQTQTPLGSPTPPPDTFLETGGAFEYGFAPANSDTSGSAYYPQFSAFGTVNNAIYAALMASGGAINNTYVEPLYVDPATAYPYLGGPPAYPFFQDGTQSPGFIGYPSGFTAFAGTTLAAGTYGLSLAIPGNTKATASTIDASATLGSTALLPALPQPAFAEDGSGGGTISITVPPGLTETLVYIVDAGANGPNFYTVEITGTGAQTAALPDTLGPDRAASITPPESGSPGDPYFVYAAGFDYPAFEAAPPDNRSAAPTIAGTNGQADVTLSTVDAVAAYGGAASGSVHRQDRRRSTRE